MSICKHTEIQRIYAYNEKLQSLHNGSKVEHDGREFITHSILLQLHVHVDKKSNSSVLELCSIYLLSFRHVSSDYSLLSSKNSCYSIGECSIPLIRRQDASRRGDCSTHAWLTVLTRCHLPAVRLSYLSSSF